MHLRSLTMKGFKSFADPTTIELEPGVTVVVGPNGSGKSNVVDAVAWVLGAQGPRVVRSAKMDDVIFVGTQKRAALGRAEVTLTIDNSDRRLPIEFSEVTIRRTLFRSGDSEYELNGVACRLLDIQELLSDSGVGRTQHVIIRQGQLDAILSANPEERRAVIEEAAGVFKYRRRRERAVRRLEATEQGLLRVQDMLREVRRQLRPLERQAASSNRHAELTAELDRLRRFIAARELRASSLPCEPRRSARVAGAELLEQHDLDRCELASPQPRSSSQRRRTSRGALGPLSRLSQLLERAEGLRALAEERVRTRGPRCSPRSTTRAGLPDFEVTRTHDRRHRTARANEEAAGEAGRRRARERRERASSSAATTSMSSTGGAEATCHGPAADAGGWSSSGALHLRSRRAVS